MVEIEYKICKVIKEFYEKRGTYPRIDSISRRISYSTSGTRYHLNKLMKLKIVNKNYDKTYSLLVNNLK